MKHKYIFRVTYSLLLLAFVSLSFMASNCNDILNALTSDDVVGTWTLTNQGGAQYDICNGETVTFTSSTATLTCPGSSPITRNYTASGGVLTYTDTGMSYGYSVSSSTGSTVLTLTGRNSVNRILEYTKQSTDKQSSGSQQKSSSDNIKNSSEVR